MRAYDWDWDPNLDPVVWHLLEVSLQLSQLSKDMAQGLHMVTQELLSLRQIALGVVLAFPNQAQDAQHLLTKLTANDDVEAFLGTFEKVTTQEGWALRDWSCALASLVPLARHGGRGTQLWPAKSPISEDDPI